MANRITMKQMEEMNELNMKGNFDDIETAARFVALVESSGITDMYKKAKELNAAAAKMIAEKFPEIRTDDLFAVMDPLDRKAYFIDKCHPNDAGKKIVAAAVAKCLMER